MTQGRKNTPKVEVEIIDAAGEQRVEHAIALARQDATAQALATSQHDAAVRAVAVQIGYQLPADCTDPDLIQRDISANMRRSVEACLEVGRGLVVLKQACQHGQFMTRLEALGLDASVVRRFMQAATKFSKRAAPHVLAAAGSQAKLFELLILDDDQIEALEMTGQTGNLKLDDIDSMSQKELRAKVRELQADLEATEAISAEKTKRNEDLTKSLRRIQAAPPDQVLAELHAESTRMANDARGAVIGNLRQAIRAVQQHHETNGGDSTAFLAGLVAQLANDLVELRLEFDLPEINTNEHGWIDSEAA